MKRLECLVALLAVGVVSSASGELWGSSLQRFSDQVILANRCLPTGPADVPIGGACGAGNTCVGQGPCSSCTGGRCACNDDFKEFDLIEIGGTRKICVGDTRIGRGCTENEQCVSFHPLELSSCEGTSHQCQCITDYIHSTDFERCLRIRDLLGDPCEDDTQCQGSIPTGPGAHSRCFNNRCECKPEAVNVIGFNKCYLKATQLRGQCEVNVQCEVLRAICSPNNDCVCDANNVPHPDGSICLLRRSMTGEECEDDVQCITNSKCVKPANNPRGVCTCDPGFEESSSRRTCYSLAQQLGDPCVRSDDTGNVQCGTNIRGPVECRPTNTTHGSCACSTGNVGSGDGKACLPVRVELEDPCDDDTQCLVENSRCRIRNPETGAAFCECQDDHANMQGDMTKCWRIIREINTKCEIDFQCRTGMGDLSDCKDQLCQCRDRYGYYQGRCYAPAKMDWPCTEPEQCFIGVRPKPISTWFLCTNTTDDNTDGVNRCKCRPDAKAFEGSCYDTSVTLGSDCEYDEQCTVNIHRGSSLCDRNTNKCVCAEGYSEDASKVICSTGSGIFSHYSFILIGVVTLFLKALL